WSDPPTFPPPFGLLAEGTTREPLDEAVEERVVEQSERDARDERRRHQRLPEEHVAADQVVRYPRRHRALRRRRDERERVDELVDAEREGEDDDGQDPRQRDREHDPVERLDP